MIYICSVINNKLKINIMKNLNKTQLAERRVIITMMEERGMDVEKYMKDCEFLKIINAMAASGCK